MRKYNKFKKYLLFAVIVGVLICYAEPSRGVITGVTFTTVAAPTAMSTNNFYLAGNTYTFIFDVTDDDTPAAAAWADLNSITLSIPPDITVVLNAFGAGPTYTIVPTNCTATAGIAGTPNNFTVTINVTVLWNTPESTVLARNITATVDDSTGPNDNDTSNVTYGVSSSVRVLNFVNDTIGADGYVNPDHTGFNVTGTLVYNIPGAVAADNVATNSGDVTGTILLKDGVTTAVAGGTNNLSFNIPAGTIINAAQAAPYVWSIEASMTTGAATETAVNTAQIYCDNVQINRVEVIGAGGTLILPTAINDRRYYKSSGGAAQDVRIYAQMDQIGGNVKGDTTIGIDVNNDDGVDFSITIPNGQPYWDGAMPVPGVGAGSSSEITYKVCSITGGVTDTGQNTQAEIPQPGNSGGNYTTVVWDNADPPGGGAGDFTGSINAATSTASGITLSWTTPLSDPGPPYDGDLYSYKVYYKVSTDPTYTVVDRTSDVTLANIALLSYTITGLAPITNYDWKLSAIDIFGNEVAGANQPSGTIGTLADSVTLTLSDGITQYGETEFNASNVAANFPVKKTNIRIKAFIVAAGNLPQTVAIVAADEATEPADISAMALPPAYEYTCTRTGANTWEGYIPSTSPLMVVGSSVRFVLKTTYSGVDTYIDHDHEGGAPYDDTEWRFNILSEPNFGAKPTRILNNVLTASSPTCYPSYYLPLDASVTIKVYDIKGRPVATLLDGAFRKGGRNIKDQGWSGTNRANRKLGAGLYYMQIKAESGGRVIMNKFRKVVVAW